MGNWMVMPYYGDTYGGKLKLQHGLKKTGAEQTLGEFLTFAEGRRTTLSEFVALLGKSPRPKAAVSSKADFSDGPPCLQRMAAEGFPLDGRKRALFMMAIYFRRCDQSGWKERLEEANRKFFNPPLPSDEVVGVTNSVGKKKYEYTCKEEPMKSHCDSVMCRMRTFGVGGGGNFPVFDRLVIHRGDETLWTVTIGGETITLTSDEVYEQKVFNKRCLAKIGKCFHLMKPNAWTDFLCQAAATTTAIDETKGVGEKEQFHELLEEFLTNRAKGERLEDVLSGRPFEDADEGRHWFQLRALQRYLRQESDKFRHKSRSKIAAFIRGHGGDTQNKKIGGKTVRLFWVPTSRLQKMPEIDAPPIKGDGL